MDSVEKPCEESGIVYVNKVLPGSDGKNFIPVRLYNKSLNPSDEERDKLRAQASTEKEHQVIRKYGGGSCSIDFDKIKRDDILYHLESGFMVV